MTKLDKEIVLKTLRGYAEVNRITEAERRKYLRNLTEVQARQIFNDLNTNVPGMSDKENSCLAHFRIRHHLQVRKAMELLARKNGYEFTV